uniref:Uncharacterized protein n=1 Tax=Sphaerodactylus townsendi TaxID=933632 RepID=A0ACB8G0L1_9SAUR
MLSFPILIKIKCTSFPNSSNYNARKISGSKFPTLKQIPLHTSLDSPKISKPHKLDSATGQEESPPPPAPAQTLMQFNQWFCQTTQRSPLSPMPRKGMRVCENQPQ